MLTNRRHFLASTSAAAAILAAGGQALAASRTRAPNMIFILADDLGYSDLSSYGGHGDYTTPVIDALAAQGTKFIQAYAASPICSSSRTALLTGRYQGRFKAGLDEPHARTVPDADELPTDTPTIASRLQQAGYRTALVGKWHVGKVPEFSPRRYGYDYFFGITGGGADYFKHRAIQDPDTPEYGLWENDKPVQRPGYLTDIFADEAIKQIRAGGDKPLFLSLHFNAPHWPWEGPDSQAHSKALKDMRDRSGGSLETFAKMMRSLDSNIGRVLAAVDQAGMSQDTIVIFTSDNGGERYSNMWPLTGTKGELLEGGLRVPLLIRWPGKIKPGSVSNQVTSSFDFAPTLLAAAGIQSDGWDGTNILPQILGAAPPIPRTIYWRFKASNQAAVRSGDWKYLRLGGKEHLFNVAADPRERAELATVHPEIFEDLKAKWAAWNTTMLPYGPDNTSEETKKFYPDRY